MIERKEHRYAHFGDTTGHKFINNVLPDLQLNAIKADEINGVFLCINSFTEIHHNTIEFCRRINEEQCLDLILAIYSCPGKKPNINVVNKAKSITNKIALSNLKTIEWRGDLDEAIKYYNFSIKNDIEWVCFITHNAICHDIRNGSSLRDFLVEKNIFCVCACGYVLAAYLYDDFTMPDLRATSLRSRNLFTQFGLTVEKMQKYLEPLEIISGVGGMKGLARGSYLYLKQLNFKGILVSAPYNLNNIEKPKINNVPSIYPSYLGARRKHLPKYRSELKHPVDVRVKNAFITFAWDNTICIPRWDHHKRQWALGYKINHDVTRIICNFFRQGYDIGIVTSRIESNETEMETCPIPLFPRSNATTQALRLHKTIDMNELPIKKVFFTNGKEKGPLLKKIGSVLHFDHDKKQLDSARKYGIKARKLATNPEKLLPLAYDKLL